MRIICHKQLGCDWLIFHFCHHKSFFYWIQLCHQLWNHGWDLHKSWIGGDWTFFNDITKLTPNFHQTLAKLSPNFKQTFIKHSPILNNFCLPFLGLALSEHASYQKVIQHHHDLGLLYHNFSSWCKCAFWKELWIESINQALTIYHSGSSLRRGNNAQSEQVSAWCTYQRKQKLNQEKEKQDLLDVIGIWFHSEWWYGRIQRWYGLNDITQQLF